MTSRSPFLALAIEGRIDGNGAVLSADPHLMRLHKANGGVEGGVLAVPPLLTLARLAWSTGAKLERAVTVADGDSDAELWVGAVRHDDHVRLSISGWQDAAMRRTPSGKAPASSSHGAITQPDTAIILDAKGTIVGIAPQFIDAIGLANIGRSITSAIRQPEHVDIGTLGASSADGIAVQLKVSDLQYRLTASYILDGDGERIGFECKLQEPPPEANAEPAPEDKATNIGFGRQFASAVRQPLSRIIANAETIGAHVNGPIKESYAGYAQDIASAARHLSELVSDLEDLDAIDRVDFKVASEKVELGDIAQRVAGLLALKAADHHIAIELPSAEERVEVVGEFRRILQIVLNLIGNAIRYAPDGTTVRIAVSNQPASLSVSDQGHGRRLARAMKGDLVVGESPEGGAMFTLSLPPFDRN
jgi:signal transduction histidine kinase